MKTIVKIKREIIYQILLFIAMIFMTVGYNLSSYSIAALILFFFFDKNLRKKIKTVELGLYLPFLIYFFLLVVGLIYTSNMDKGIKLLTTSISFLILPLIILTEKISRERIFKILLGYKYWLIALAIYLIIHKLFIQGGPLWTLTLFTLKTEIGIHQLYFSQFYYLGLLITSYQIIQKRKSVFLFLELLFFIFFIILLGSITAIVITVATIFILITFFFSKETLLIKSLLILSLLIGGFFISKTTIVKSKIKKLDTIEWSLQKNIEKHKKFKEGFGKVNTLNLRFLKWYSAKEIIEDNFFTGVGTGDGIDKLVEEYEKIEFKNGIEGRLNAHNQYLETFLKLGIFGLMSLLLLIIFALKFALKNQSYFIFFIILFISISFVLESMLERQHGVLFMCFFLPLFYVFDKVKKNKV